ncbi:hypothetical protein C8J57DRAFT_1230455 [Mycena rebaudengoi]|nr:hypothetical protein C8J57DRAFT_1230455 [Mycena rebaudengoi]
MFLAADGAEVCGVILHNRTMNTAIFRAEFQEMLAPPTMGEGGWATQRNVHFNHRDCGGGEGVHVHVKVLLGEEREAGERRVLQLLRNEHKVQGGPGVVWRRVKRRCSRLHELSEAVSCHRVDEGGRVTALGTEGEERTRPQRMVLVKVTKHRERMARGEGEEGGEGMVKGVYCGVI